MSKSRSSTSSTSSNGGQISVGSTPYTLYLRVHSAENLQLATSQASYCKLYLGETPVVRATHATFTSLFMGKNDDGDRDAGHRTFHTQVCQSQDRQIAVWNEKMELAVMDPKHEILSIRVKSYHQLYCPSIGACAIYLKQLRTGQPVDKKFPLLKGDKEVGLIRLQMALESTSDVVKAERARSQVGSTKSTKPKERTKTEAEIEEAAWKQRRYEQEQREAERRRQEDNALRMEVEATMKRERDEAAARQASRERVEKPVAAKSTWSDNQTPEYDGMKEQPRSRKQSNDSSRDDRRRSTIDLDSIDDAIQFVTHDALPSDSEDDDGDEQDNNIEESDDEDELMRQMLELQLKLAKKKKEKRQAEKIGHGAPPSARRSDPTVEYHDHMRKVKSEPHNPMSASSSSRPRPEARSKSMRQPSLSDSDEDDDVVQSIRAMTPGQIEKKIGADSGARPSLGQVWGAATSAATLVTGVASGEELEETVPNAIDAIKEFAPIGNYLSRKLHAASAQVLQKQQPRSVHHHRASAPSIPEPTDSYHPKFNQVGQRVSEPPLTSPPRKQRPSQPPPPQPHQEPTYYF